MRPIELPWLIILALADKPANPEAITIKSRLDCEIFYTGMYTDDWIKIITNEEKVNGGFGILTAR